jgi:hypothetical protein
MLRPERRGAVMDRKVPDQTQGLAPTGAPSPSVSAEGFPTKPGRKSAAANFRMTNSGNNPSSPTTSIPPHPEGAAKRRVPKGEAARRVARPNTCSRRIAWAALWFETRAKMRAPHHEGGARSRVGRGPRLRPVPTVLGLICGRPTRWARFALSTLHLRRLQCGNSNEPQCRIRPSKTACRQT